MSTLPALSASNALPAASKQVSARRHAEALRQFARQLRRDAARIVRRAVRQHDVAEIDRGAQRAGRRQLLQNVGSAHSSSCGRDLRVRLIAAFQRFGDEAARLHLLDEGAQIGGAGERGPSACPSPGGFPGNGRPSRARPGASFAYSTSGWRTPADRVELLGAEQVDHRAAAAGRGAHQRGMLQRAGEVEVVGRVRARSRCACRRDRRRRRFSGRVLQHQ